MSFVSNTALDALQSGIMVLGILVTFKILGIPDMTVEGSFPLGGAVTSRLLVASHGIDPLLATMAGLAVGCLAGLVTGMCFSRLGLNVVVAGILVGTAAYSVQLEVLGAPDVSLYGHRTVFDLFSPVAPVITDMWLEIAVLAGIVAICAMAVYGVLRTDFGLALRSLGDNTTMLRGTGVRTERVVVISLVASNGLVGLSGSLVAQTSAFSAVSFGTSELIAAVASLVVGLALVGTRKLWRLVLAAALVGPLVYQGILNGILRTGFSNTSFDLISSTLVAAAVSAPYLRRQFLNGPQLRKMRSWFGHATTDPGPGRAVVPAGARSQMKREDPLWKSD